MDKNSMKGSTELIGRAMDALRVMRDDESQEIRETAQQYLTILQLPHDTIARLHLAVKVEQNIH